MTCWNNDSTNSSGNKSRVIRTIYKVWQCELWLKRARLTVVSCEQVSRVGGAKPLSQAFEWETITTEGDFP